MTTLLLSQGVPMIRHGDEIGHTQLGNNNAYCQDNEISWLDWERADAGFLGFCAELIEFRRQHPVFRRRRFFEGEPVTGTRQSDADIGWFRPDGKEMSPEDWDAGFAKSVAVFLNGDALPDPDRRGQRLTDDTFLLLFNAHHDDVTFALPSRAFGRQWVTDIDSAETSAAPPRRKTHRASAKVVVTARSVQVLRRGQ
jgi:isoamylase